MSLVSLLRKVLISALVKDAKYFGLPLPIPKEDPLLKNVRAESPCRS